MHRRDFLKKAATTGAVLASARLLGKQSGALAEIGPGPQGGPQPNILFILVDEMRYPRVFPPGVEDAGEFLRRFMPNTYSLWRRGVKFAGHYTAGIACTPARGTLITGFYTQQSWLLQTILDSPTTKVSVQPVLNREYPTYGKLLRQAGYQTPYIGKWHLSIPHRGPGEELNAYGFEGLTDPDPTGSNLQGTVGDPAAGYLSDADIANQAADWLKERKPGDTPWCLTVGFVNPHDKEFFPAGTEFQTFTDLFNSTAYNPDGLAQFIDFTAGPPTYDWNTNPLKRPPLLPYPAVPPNWESADQIASNKPSTQTYVRLFQEAVWGGVSDDPSATDFSIMEYPTNPDYPPLVPPDGVAKAPYSYWRRSLDSYTQIMRILDQHIGSVLHNLRPEVAQNTIIAFTSDHGEYASAHGFVSGKAGSCYEEVYNVPLIVVDPSGRFNGDIDTIRAGLTSSVDILPMLVSLGYNGSDSWMTGDLATIYGQRHNLLPMLKSADASGRPYVVFTTDEVVPLLYNFNSSPGHIIGVRTPDAKLGVYAHWLTGTTEIALDTIEIEYYDYATPGGRLETDNQKDLPGAAELLTRLLEDILPNELRAPLPDSLVPAQTIAKGLYLGYANLINTLTASALPLMIGDA
jgi:arylsulfatase A-like enzyme